LSLLDRAREKLFAWSNGDETPLQSAEDQSESDKALVSFVENELNDRRQASSRTACEGIALTNVAYLCGFDGVWFDTVSRSFKPIPAPSQLLARNRVHVNRILPTCQNRLARLMKNEPRWEVRPNSSDEDDKDSARLAEQILIQLWDQLGINKSRAHLLMLAMQSGSSYLKVCWDVSKGEKKVMPSEKVNEETGETTRTYDLVAEGDIRVDVCSYFEIFPDVNAKYWSENTSILQVKVRPLSYFKDQYPERGHLVKEEDVWLNSLQYEARINALNTVTGASAQGGASIKNSAIERLYYEKPSKKHPMGRYIVTANGVLLHDGILPIDEIPFVKFDDIIIGGKFNGEAIITHLRPLQDQINRGKSMRAAWMQRMLTGKWIAARGHNLSREALNDQSGEVVEYDPMPHSPEPHAMEVPVIPSYAYEEEQTLKTDMDDTAGVNEASRGQMPSAQIPAIGMQLLVEQDDTRIGVETESHEHSYADLGRILLKFVAKYYETPRLLKITGKDMAYMVKSFQGSDLRDNFDVHVKRGSIAPGSKTLRRQEIMNLHQGGYFGNPQDPLVIQNVLEMLEYGDEYQAWKKHSLRMRQIERGLEMIEKDGAKPPVSEFDDHALWLQELDNYRLGDKFLTLSPDQQQIVLVLMNEHADLLTEMAAGPVDPDNDPELVPTTAAQEAEAAVTQEPMPEDTAGAQLQAQIDNGPNQPPGMGEMNV
jgi:hypothetical protein